MHRGCSVYVLLPPCPMPWGPRQCSLSSQTEQTQSRVKGGPPPRSKEVKGGTLCRYHVNPLHYHVSSQQWVPFYRLSHFTDEKRGSERFSCLHKTPQHIWDSSPAAVPQCGVVRVPGTEGSWPGPECTRRVPRAAPVAVGAGGHGEALLEAVLSLGTHGGPAEAVPARSQFCPV